MWQPTVLVVDPDEDTRIIVSDLLAAHDYEVITAPTAAEARYVAAGRPVDLLITELWDAYRGHNLPLILQSLPDLSGVPIIVYSAWTFPEVHSDMISARVAQFLTKPTELTVLLNHVR